MLIEVKKKTKLNSLTSFRFIAALMVFLFHVGFFTKYQTGYLGVSFFFILSGFILAYNYYNKLINLSATEIKKFFIARIAKVYPVHFITFLIAIPYYFFIPLKHDSILYFFQALTNMLLIHSFIPFGNVSFNGVSWSLSDEMFFYATFPFCILFFLNYLQGILRKMLFILGIWIMTILLIITTFPEPSNFNTWFAYFFPGVRLVEFLVGIFLGLVFIEKEKYLSKLPKIIFSILEILTLTLLVVMILIAPIFIQNLRYGLIFIPFWANLIFVFSFQKGFLSKILSNKILVYLGEISFSFYMIHNLVLSYILFLWKPDLQESILIGACLGISLVLSAIMYRFYEEPVRYKMREYLNNKFVYKNKTEINSTKVFNTL